VPGVVLLAGVAGLVYADPAAREQAVAVLAGVLPPLRDVVEAVLAEVSRSAAPVSIIGAIALVWGTSRFVVSFEDAISRVTGGSHRRGILAQNLGALVAVVLMVAAIPASAMLSAVADFLEAGAAGGVFEAVGAALSLALQALPVVATIGATILVYRIVPRPGPTWRATVIPGVTIGIVLTVIARIFVFLAPRLIGTAALIGTLATVFAALAWLALSFQAILVGASWVRDREDAIQAAAVRRSAEESA
jgi:uncharacterized BrkB/YihY/UPF0761 family membrane protein